MESTFGSSCRSAVFDLSGVESAEFTSNGDFTDQYGAEIWCPSGSVSACHLIGTQDDSFNGLNVYVDEWYSYDYLEIDCSSSASCNSVDVSCDGDAGIQSVKMVYISDGYECSNGNASFCCPYRNCSTFNDPQIGFDPTLIDSYPNVTKLINGTAQNVQSSMKCTDSICGIRCDGLLSCAYAVMTTQSQETVIECEGTFSCLGAEVIVDDSLSDHSVKIVCFGMCFHSGMPVSFSLYTCFIRVFL